MAYTENMFTAADIRKLKVELKKFPAGMSRSSMAKKIAESWKQNVDRIDRWITLAESFSDEVVDLFDAGKISRSCLQEIGRSDFGNPAYKDFLARKAIEENLSTGEIKEVREYIRSGRHPTEAIDILRGRRSEKPITRNDNLSMERIVRELEKDGFSFRQRYILLKGMGKIQVLQNGEIKDRLAYTLAAMKVIADDMKRFTDEVWDQVPKEIQDAVAAEFSGQFVPEEAHKEPVDEIKILPACTAEEGGFSP